MGSEHVRALPAGGRGSGESRFVWLCSGLLSRSVPHTSAEPRDTPGTGAHSPPVGAVFFFRLISRTQCCLEAGQTCCLSAKLDILERGSGSHCVLLFPWETIRKWADLTKGTLHCSDVFPFVQSFSLHKFPGRSVGWASLRPPPQAPSIS